MDFEGMEMDGPGIVRRFICLFSFLFLRFDFQFLHDIPGEVGGFGGLQIKEGGNQAIYGKGSNGKEREMDKW